MTRHRLKRVDRPSPDRKTPENARMREVGMQLSEGRNWWWHGARLVVGKRQVGRQVNGTDSEFTMLNPRFAARAVEILERVVPKLRLGRMPLTAASVEHAMLMLVIAQPLHPDYKRALTRLNEMPEDDVVAREFTLRPSLETLKG